MAGSLFYLLSYLITRGEDWWVPFSSVIERPLTLDQLSAV